MFRLRRLLLLAGAVLMPSMSSGCFMGINPFGMGFYTPIPMQPWVADRIEDGLLTRRPSHTDLAADSARSPPNVRGSAGQG